MKNDKINLSKWINENTEDSTTVVELGAGFFNRLESTHSNVKFKIGIEIYEPYIINAKYNDCIKIHGNALKFQEYLTEFDYDTALIVDVLEHFEKNVGYDWIEKLKTKFNKILLMLPVGKYEQSTDVTGFGGHEYQTHKSYWYENDIDKLRFDENIIDLYFHPKHHDGELKNEDTSCYFGVWHKNK